jgi:hypothetical protein
MIQAQLASPWMGSGETMADAYRPQIAHDYVLASCTQVGNTNPPAPLTVVIVCTPDVWSAIQADPTYNQNIAWSETL